MSITIFNPTIQLSPSSDSLVNRELGLFLDFVSLMLVSRSLCISRVSNATSCSSLADVLELTLDRYSLVYFLLSNHHLMGLGYLVKIVSFSSHVQHPHLAEI